MTIRPDDLPTCAALGIEVVSVIRALTKSQSDGSDPQGQRFVEISLARVRFAERDPDDAARRTPRPDPPGPSRARPVRVRCAPKNASFLR